MPIISVSSLDDPRLETFRNLKDTNLTRWQGKFICEGEKLVRRLLDSEYEVDSLLLSQRAARDCQLDLPPDCPIYVIPDALVDDLVGFNFHRGYLGCGRRKPSPSLDRIPSNLPGISTLVICPEVRDPVNLGAILRISLAFGASGVMTGPTAADPFSRRVLRVSMGAALQVPVYASRAVSADLKTLKDELGFRLVASVLDPGAVPIQSFRRSDRVALLLGNEGDGLPQEWIDLATDRVTIPMTGPADSLNVGVAAGIMLFHLNLSRDA